MAWNLFTSESVTEGHPDKICDQISDGILDAILAQDKRCRVAVETLVKTGMVVVAGEVTTEAAFNASQIARAVVRDIGYTSSDMGFDAETCAVLVALEKQSPDIARGVDNDKDQGAGDQGMMFGYACDETQSLMPLPITLAHRLTRRLAEARKKKELTFLRPDGKSQVTVQYANGEPVRVEAVVVSTQHQDGIKYKALRDAVVDEIIKKAVPASLIDKDTKIHVNPTGRFVYGGPFADSGVTGRKIIVDTYGGMGRHGGGAFSGKDPSKVDRSAAYFARYVAKNIVASGVARRAEVQLAYAIGVAQPVSVYVDTFGTGVVPDERIGRWVMDNLDMRPRAITETLDLLRPIYRATASYGHFGRSEASFTWERTDRAAAMADGLLQNGEKAAAVARKKGRRAAAALEV